MTNSVIPRVTTASPHFLDVVFAPQSVAVFGATEAPGSVGRTLMSNLIRNPFGGVLFPISQQHRNILGVEAYPDLMSVPEPVDLAVVATPAATVPAILSNCAEARVKVALVLSAGFDEIHPVGAELSRQLQQLPLHSLRVLGPDSFGVACPRTGLNATFAPSMVRPGSVAFLSQCGSILTALLSPDHSEHVGCSAFVSVGSQVNIGWAEWLDYLADDAQTECVAIYMERLGDARAFFTAARALAPHKPIVLLKGHGGEQENDEAFEEACRRSGVLRVHRMADLFRMAAHLTSHPVPRGRRLMVLSNARGPAVLATDALRASGGQLAALTPETVAMLGEITTPRWNRNNPIDVGDDANETRLVQVAAAAIADPNADALLVLLTPQAAMDPVQAAQGLRRVAGSIQKPVLACWLWGAETPESRAILRGTGIPTYHSPEAAVRAFSYLWRHTENLRGLKDLTEASVEIPEKTDPSSGKA